MITPAINTAQTTIAATAVTLARYAQRIGYPECQFFGVYNADTLEKYQCNEIWTQDMRAMVAFYLMEAQHEIENELQYPLQPTYIRGEQDGSSGARLVDQQDYSCPMITRWGWVLEVGQEARTAVALSEALITASDPSVTAAFPAGDVTSIDEVYVYHEGVDVQIIPSDITLSGGNLTITIPRCRTVLPAYMDNTTSGIDYSDLTKFASAIDVYRVYTDDTTQVTCKGCTCETAGSGTLTIHNNEIGEVSPDICGCGCSRVGLWYRAGLKYLAPQMEDSIIRLAHSKMPQQPCGCDPVRHLWQRDRNIPDALTRERINCPFGLSDGAWISWRFVETNRLVRAGVI